jgi:hypothetical protein
MKTIEQINKEIRDLMDPSKNSSPEILKQNMFHPDNPADGNPIIAYKNHVLRVKKALETNGSSALGIQAAFKAMNPGPIGTGKLSNPLFPFGAPPGSSTTLTDSADIISSAPLEDASIRLDVHKHNSIRNEKLSSQMNLFSNENPATKHTFVDFESGEGTKTEELNGVQFKVVDYSKLFDERSTGFDFGSGEKGYKGYKPKLASRIPKSQKMRKEEFALENTDTFFSLADSRKGYVLEDEFNSAGIEDSTNYLPFYIEDLRNTGSNRKRIYFRAFLSGLRESISPSWTKDEYFGRVEPIGSYKGTSRSVSFSFSLVAMSQPGFATMWRKANQLAKMFYPTMRNGVMVKAPTARVRIGDVICDANGNGLPGYFSAPMELEYGEATWETTPWVGGGDGEVGKAPQQIKVSLSFDIIHESVPKLDEFGNFDVSLFRRVGAIDLDRQNATDEGEE